MQVCASCGRENPDDARFCAGCGTELASAEAPRGEVRKTVTVLFSDVTGSTALGERLDPETTRTVMARYFDAMRTVIERHGGTVEKFIGDAVMAVFGIPVVHEDDALRAVRAAAEMRSALATLNDELERDRGVRIETRTGINTGEVVAGSGETLVTGDAVNVAARLEQAAAPGEILLGDATRRLVRDAVDVELLAPLDLKGKSAAVEAWRLAAVREGADAFRRRTDSRLVGRERERSLLRQAFDRAVEDRGCHLFTVLGTAGVGKSRLVADLLEWVDGRALSLVGRCLPYGDGITYWPLASVVREAAGISDDLAPEEARGRIEALLPGSPDAPVVAERVAAAIGVEAVGGGGEETAWAVRKLFEGLAAERPLVLVFDDIHWGEPTFLDLIEQLADWSRDAPILLVAVARPELLDKRPGWGGGKLNATTILLEGLSLEDSARLVGALLDDIELPAGLRARITEAAEGNPLFVEEMLALALEQGADDDLPVPPTIQALLAARLDTLTPGERDTLERAAVAGKEFSRGALVELADEGADVEGCLRALVRKELLRPTASPFAGEDSFRFRHILIRDAAYSALPKTLRAELHERFARRLERTMGDQLRAYDEILGYHLEQAFRYRAELGSVDDAARSLAAEAGAVLGRAGMRASGRGDLPGSARLLERAVELEPNGELRRLHLVSLGSALWEGGDFERARQLFAEARDESREAGDRARELHASLWLSFDRLQTDPTVEIEDAGAQASSAIVELEQLDDDPALIRAWQMLLFYNLVLSRSAPLLEAAEQVHVIAQRSGDEREGALAYFWLAGAHWLGPTPARAGLRRCEQLLEQASGPLAAAGALNAVALLKGLLGEFDEARAIVRDARRLYLELGLRVWWAGISLGEAWVEWLAGDYAAAERVLREGADELERLGETGYLSTLIAYVGHCALERGDEAEAERCAELSERSAAAADVASQSLFRTLRARLLARRGELDAAEKLAREGVRIINASDGLEQQADALVWLAEVLVAAGEADEATAALTDALERYTAKEALPKAERTRLLLHGLSAAAS